MNRIIIFFFLLCAAASVRGQINIATQDSAKKIFQMSEMSPYKFTPQSRDGQVKLMSFPVQSDF